MSTNLEQELVGLERRYWDAMMTKDGSEAARLTGARQIYAGPTGVSTIERASVGAMVRSDGWKLKGYEFRDVTVLSPSADTAIVAYHVSERVEVDGEDLTFDANDSTVWQRQGEGEWVCILHTESLEGDPFGRDRTNGH